ncbi:Rho-binding antiterminator [Oceanimonas sp. CHS3-5]|uniref:Rho-binding antiterminator n=1 Tax=Oceanimonas sp. CHS3-5 TaxID=3068186 RepID=UPI002740165D|nr:Rho-binding antiterminator [Oceanimonas sp. CHS3-5]MDP5293316.1 Rho-binding antiterminator [Oceanimonas sp. CHS3-5]
MMSCEQHDYIEIACLYRYAVTLTLVSGEQVSGMALNTTRNTDKEECLTLLIGNEVRLLPLASLARMTAVQPNPHFVQVDFN